MSEDADCAIIGGGLAGCMVALELAKAGRSAILLEKSKGAHNKVCGEFLSSESLHYLSRHGVDVLALGGVPIRKVRLAAKNVFQETDLPFAALSLTRRKLDEEMLRLVSAAGMEVRRGAHVEQLQKQHGLWSVRLRDGPTLHTRTAFLATGKSDLRGWSRPPGTHRELVAFKMYYRLSAAQQLELGQAVELILFPDGYAGLQPVEDGAANLCLLVHADRLQSAGSSWSGALRHILERSPHMTRRLEGAQPLLEAPLAASQIPYGHLQRNAQKGLWRVGDQAAVIPSFSGDGMSIALHSGALASSQFLQGVSSESYQRKLHRQLAPRLWAATKLSQLLISMPQLVHLVRSFPFLLPSIALMTRIPSSALLTQTFFRD